MSLIEVLYIFWRLSFLTPSAYKLSLQQYFLFASLVVEFKQTTILFSLSWALASSF